MNFSKVWPHFLHSSFSSHSLFILVLSCSFLFFLLLLSSFFFVSSFHFISNFISSFFQLHRSSKVFLVLAIIQAMALLGLGISVLGELLSFLLVDFFCGLLFCETRSLLWTVNSTPNSSLDLGSLNFIGPLCSFVCLSVTSGASYCTESNGHSCDISWRVYSIVYIYATIYFLMFAYDTVNSCSSLKTPQPNQRNLQAPWFSPAFFSSHLVLVERSAMRTQFPWCSSSWLQWFCLCLEAWSWMTPPGPRPRTGYSWEARG